MELEALTTTRENHRLDRIVSYPLTQSKVMDAKPVMMPVSHTLYRKQNTGCLCTVCACASTQRGTSHLHHNTEMLMYCVIKWTVNFFQKNDKYKDQLL